MGYVLANHVWVWYQMEGKVGRSVLVIKKNPMNMVLLCDLKGDFMDLNRI